MKRGRRRQRPPPSLTCIIIAVIVAVFITGGGEQSRKTSSIVGIVVQAQPPVDETGFTRQVPCPNTDPIIMGYTSISDLNDDMAAELSRLESLGESIPPEERRDYILNLCSDPDNVFDATGNNPIRPVLDKVQIYCGGQDANTDDQSCLIDASTQQVVVEDITTSLPDYELTQVLFQGLTFRRFSRGLSVSLIASDPASATFIDCIWEDFDDNDYVINIDNNNNNDAMTLILTNAIIRSTEGDPNEANAADAFINNQGGTVIVEGIQILDAFPESTVFNNQNNGQMTVSNVVVERSVLAQSFARMNSGVITFNSVTISNSIALDNVIFIRGRRTEVFIDNLSMVDNVVDNVWNGINLSQGATLTMSGTTFRGNTNILFGVTVQAFPNAPSTALLTDSTFVGNVGSGIAFGLQSSLINALGNNNDEPFIEILRADFVGNTGFVSNINAFQGGKFRLIQACFTGNTGRDVVNAGPGSESSTGELNFVDSSEVSENCPDNPDRFNVAAQGCVLLSDADMCLSQIVFTDNPSDAPTEFPTQSPTDFPTDSPSFTPTTFPTAMMQGPTGEPSTSIEPSTSAVPSATATESREPSTSIEPSASAAPSDNVTAAPKMAPSLPPISRPTFRRVCDQVHGDEGDDGCDEKRSKKFSIKSSKKRSYDKMRKKSKDKKYYKSSKQSKKSSGKGGGGGEFKQYWGPVGGANGVYREKSFAKAWAADGGLRGWEFEFLNFNSNDGDGGRNRQLLFSNVTVN